MSARSILHDALYGSPANPSHKPSRAGVMQAFAELEKVASVGATGFKIFNTKALMNAYTPTKSSEKVAIVIKDVLTSNNGVYRHTGLVWEVFTEYYAGVSASVQPLVDEAVEARDEAVEARDEAVDTMFNADRAVATISARDAIPLAKRKYGLLVYVVQTDRSYRWTESANSGVDGWVIQKTDSYFTDLGNATGYLDADKLIEGNDVKLLSQTTLDKVGRMAAELGDNDEWAVFYNDLMGYVAGGLRPDGKIWEIAGTKISMGGNGDVTIQTINDKSPITLKQSGTVAHSGVEYYNTDDEIVRVTHDHDGNIVEILSSDGSIGVGGFWLKPNDVGADLIGPDGQWVIKAYNNGDAPELRGKTNTGPKEKTIVVLGSSNGAGYGTTGYIAPVDNDFICPPNSWSGLLESSLKAIDSAWVVKNASISGTGTGTAINRFWTDVAIHQPSHVIICLGAPNDSYTERLILSNTMKLAHMCRMIGAVPIVRGGYTFGNLSGGQYEGLLATNAAMDNLGLWRIDHMSNLDDGGGACVDPDVYTVGDALGHLNDAGHLVQFGNIDLNMFLYGADKPCGPNFNNKGAAWLCTTDAGNGIRLYGGGENVPNTMKSFTMRCRVKGVASGGAVGRAFMAAYVQSSTGSQPLRFRNSGTNGEFDFADKNGKIGSSSTANPTSGSGIYELVMTYNHATNIASAYVDGVLFASGELDGVLEGGANIFTFGSTQETIGSAAIGYTFADLAVWRTPLSARAVADMHRTGQLQAASLVFSGDMTSTPPSTSTYGRVPNKICNGTFAKIGSVVWQAANNF